MMLFLLSLWRRHRDAGIGIRNRGDGRRSTTSLMRFNTAGQILFTTIVWTATKTLK